MPKRSSAALWWRARRLVCSGAFDKASQHCLAPWGWMRSILQEKAIGEQVNRNPCRGEANDGTNQD